MSSEAPARAEIPIIYGWRKYIIFLESMFPKTLGATDIINHGLLVKK